MSYQPHLIKEQVIVIFILILFSPAGCTYQIDKKDLQAEEDNMSGIVIKVLDGDTYDLKLNNGDTVRIRMEGIDAPERGMPYSKVSKKYLSDLCYKRQVVIKINGYDRYNRILAYTFTEDGSELSHEMVRAGLAWHYKQYNSEASLAGLEVEARDMKRGLWADKEPLPPWTYRRMKKKGTSLKQQLTDEKE